MLLTQFRSFAIALEKYLRIKFLVLFCIAFLRKAHTLMHTNQQFRCFSILQIRKLRLAALGSMPHWWPLSVWVEQVISLKIEYFPPPPKKKTLISKREEK